MDLNIQHSIQKELIKISNNHYFFTTFKKCGHKVPTTDCIVDYVDCLCGKHKILKCPICYHKCNGKIGTSIKEHNLILLGLKPRLKPIPCNNEAVWKVISPLTITYHCNSCKEFIEKNYPFPPIFEKIEKRADKN